MGYEIIVIPVVLAKYIFLVHWPLGRFAAPLELGAISTFLIYQEVSSLVLALCLLPVTSGIAYRQFEAIDRADTNKPRLHRMFASLRLAPVMTVALMFVLKVMPMLTHASQMQYWLAALSVAVCVGLTAYWLERHPLLTIGNRGIEAGARNVGQ